MIEPRPKLTLTSTRQLAVAALAGAIISWLILGGIELAGAFPPVVPWSLPAVLAVLALGVFGYARSLRRRVTANSVPTREGFTAVVAAKSIVFTGAVLAGGHVTYVMQQVPRLTAELPVNRAINGTVTLLVSLALVWAGYQLERACILPEDDGDTAEEENN